MVWCTGVISSQKLMETSWLGLAATRVKFQHDAIRIGSNASPLHLSQIMRLECQKVSISWIPMRMRITRIERKRYRKRSRKAKG